MEENEVTSVADAVEYVRGQVVTLLLLCLEYTNDYANIDLYSQIQELIQLGGLSSESGGGGGTGSGTIQIVYRTLDKYGYLVEESAKYVKKGDTVNLKRGKAPVIGKDGYAVYFRWDAWACPLPIVNDTITIPDWIDDDATIYLDAVYAPATSVEQYIQFVGVKLTGEFSIIPDYGCQSMALLKYSDSFLEHINSPWLNEYFGLYKGVRKWYLAPTPTMTKLPCYYLDEEDVPTEAYFMSYNIPPSVTTIGDYAFYYNQIQSINIPSSVTSIGVYAFSFSNIKSIIIPSGVTVLPTGAFQACMLLNSVSLPPTITTIGSVCFNACISLGEITIPESVTTINNGAFSGYYRLTVHVKRSTPPTLGSNVFSNPIGTQTFLKIYVPSNKVTTYKNATNWSAYKNYIYAEPSS